MSSKSGYRTKIPSETKGIEGVREEKERDKEGKEKGTQGCRGGPVGT